MLWIGDSLKAKLRIGIFLSLAFHFNIKADQINDGLLAMLKIPYAFHMKFIFSTLPL